MLKFGQDRGSKTASGITRSMAFYIVLAREPLLIRTSDAWF